MMHESKGQCIGKAPPLHLFHTVYIQLDMHGCLPKMSLQAHNLEWQFMAVASFSGHKDASNWIGIEASIISGI